MDGEKKKDRLIDEKKRSWEVLKKGNEVFMWRLWRKRKTQTRVEK